VRPRFLELLRLLARQEVDFIVVGGVAAILEGVPISVREIADLRIRVLELARVIKTKEQAGRDKDLAMLPVLRRTLEMRRESEAE